MAIIRASIILAAAFTFGSAIYDQLRNSDPESLIKQ